MTLMLPSLEKAYKLHTWKIYDKCLCLTEYLELLRIVISIQNTICRVQTYKQTNKQIK